MLRGEHAAGPRRLRRRHRFSSSRGIHVIHTYTHTYAHNIMYILQLYTSDTREEYSSCLYAIWGGTYISYRRSRMIILMCAVFVIIFFFFNEHISPTTYPEKEKKYIITENVDQHRRFPVRDVPTYIIRLINGECYYNIICTHIGTYENPIVQDTMCEQKLSV